MQTHRFLVPKTHITEKSFQISDLPTIKKISKVLRLQPFDKITIFDGEGSEYEAEIITLTKTEVSGKILTEKPIEMPVRPYVILAQALPKLNKLDDIVRMNTEIGVSEFIFFESTFSSSKITDLTSKKIERLTRIIEEAVRQSEQAYIPTIKTVKTLEEISKINSDIKITFHSRDFAGSQDLKKVRSDVQQNSKVLLVIGPEGGFSEQELNLLSTEFQIVHLNLPILRTETAGIVASAFILAENRKV